MSFIYVYNQYILNFRERYFEANCKVRFIHASCHSFEEFDRGILFISFFLKLPLILFENSICSASKQEETKYYNCVILVNKQEFLILQNKALIEFLKFGSRNIKV